MVISDNQVVYLMTVLHDCLKADSKIGNIEGAYMIRPSYNFESMVIMYEQLIKQQSHELKEIE